MIKFAVGMLAAGGSLFSMCQGGPVPEGCCKRGDQLNVVMVDRPSWIEDCNDMGGKPVTDRDGRRLCTNVDF